MDKVQVNNSLKGIKLSIALQKVKDRNTITIMGFSTTPEQLQYLIDRVPEGAKIETIDLEKGPKNNILSCRLWLAENNIIGADATTIIKGIFNFLSTELNKRKPL